MRSPIEKLTLSLSRTIHKSTKTETNAKYAEDHSSFKSLSTSKKRTSEEINLVLKDVMNNSVAQAIIKIFQTSFLSLKIILSFIVLVTIAASSYLVISSIFAYLSFDVSTKFRTIFETPIEFPKIRFHEKFYV